MTPSFKFKKNFLIILITLAIILIAANIILKDHSSSKEEKETYINEKEISQRLRIIFLPDLKVKIDLPPLIFSIELIVRLSFLKDIYISCRTSGIERSFGT